MLRDISEARRTEAQLRHMAQHDALTGLTNRYVFHDRLIHAIELARRAKNRLAVVVLDLDRFKQVNDTHGHEAGDAPAQGSRRAPHVAPAQERHGEPHGRRRVRHHPVGARGPRRARRRHRAVAQACRGGVAFGAHELPLESSIGVAVFPDLAMYEAKRSRGRVAFASTQAPAPATKS